MVVHPCKQATPLSGASFHKHATAVSTKFMICGQGGNAGLIPIGSDLPRRGWTCPTQRLIRAPDVWYGSGASPYSEQCENVTRGCGRTGRDGDLVTG